MATAGAWYSSGTFWTGAGAATTLVVGIATVAVTYLTRFARQRLIYGLRTVAPLLTAPAGVRDELELRHRGVKMEHPFVAEVLLAGRGRRDVPRAAFDNGEPIRLDLGVRVVELLRVAVTDSASATPTPPVRFEGTALLVGPALIGRRQSILLTCLLEDEPSTVSCSAPLPNARVTRARTRDLDPLLRGEIKIMMFAVPVLACVFVFLFLLRLSGVISG
ncbi:hypothetical protein AB0C84_15550 [Actinomadura sp. NPDC048955]|uniref:hypothetical protein n=1 Tax=Actinomadura sp. NPDC048955 TaxID=3158228 RepID=UPI0033EE6856